MRPVATTQPPVRALFINSGILGQVTFARFVHRWFVGEQGEVRAEQIVLTEELTVAERLTRRALCTRLWPDGAGGLRNIDFARFRAEWHAGLLARRRIRRLEQSVGGFDVLHFHRQATAYASLGRIRSTPSIVSIDCTQRCVVGRARSGLEKWTYAPNVRRDGEIFRAARLVVTASKWAADSVREEYPDCTTEIVARRNPVELESFDPAWIDDRYSRAMDAPDRKVRVLFIGGDFPRKGGYELLTAWQAGRFAERATLDLVTTWSIEGSLLPGVLVHRGITAYSSGWQTLWRDADLFVLPTRDEAFGNVVQEAAAAGLPAIATRINALPELVSDGRSGLLVDPENATQLTRALDALISSPERRRDMGRHARDLVERAADPDAYRQFLTAAILRLGRE